MRDTERSPPGAAVVDAFESPVSVLWLFATETDKTSKQRRRALPLIEFSIDKRNGAPQLAGKVKMRLRLEHRNRESFRPFLSSKIDFQIYEMNDINKDTEKHILRSAKLL